MNILIVDDIAEVRHLIRTTIEQRLGGHAVEADSIGEALDASHRSGPFDLVITDIHMPGLSGGSLIRRLRTHEETRETPILLISGDDSNAKTVQDLLHEGADAFLGKPFTKDLLAKTIAGLLTARAETALGDTPPSVPGG